MFQRKKIIKFSTSSMLKKIDNNNFEKKHKKDNFRKKTC
jgi:hypothetical protein